MKNVALKNWSLEHGQTAIISYDLCLQGQIYKTNLTVSVFWMYSWFIIFKNFGLCLPILFRTSTFFQIKRFSEILQSVWSRASKTLNFSKHEIWNKKISIMIIVFEDHFQENPTKKFSKQKTQNTPFWPFLPKYEQNEHLEQ